MILVILGIGLVMVGLGIYLCIKHNYHSSYDEWVYWTLNTIGGSISVITIIAMVIMWAVFSNSMIIDDKIALYTEENAKIEQSIATIVDDYKDYESDTFNDLKCESPEVLFATYPELKSNELVTKQMDIYVNNNETIKKLNIEKLNYKPLAWWLYFGG